MSAQLAEIAAPVLALHASQDFNDSFWYDLQYLANDIARVLGSDLLAVVLGGGFGRGEGCITLLHGQEVPYNDVDLFLITRTTSMRGRDQLAALAERYEHRLKIAVDFSRPQTPAMIRRWKPLLMWQELALGHKVLYGPEDIISRNISPDLMLPLPMVEASRLMLNRGAGLLWAARVLAGFEPAPDESFTVRNYFKVSQAIADAALIAGQLYCSEPEKKALCIRRLCALRKLPPGVDVAGHLERSRAFRREPYADWSIAAAEIAAMARDWCSTFLWLEAQRLRRPFRDPAEYVAWEHPRERGGVRLPQTLAANLRRGRIALQHPREQVYRVLPAALQACMEKSQDFASVSEAALQDWRAAQ